MPTKYKAPSVNKAFQILRLISDNKEGLGISELSKQSTIGKSTVHGVTSALQEVGAIVRDPSTKRFTLGFTLLELGRSAHSNFDLKDVARPFMEALMARTRTSVFLGIQNHTHVTILDIVESTQDLKITSPIGTTIPLMAGAVGKVFLASMDEVQAMDLIQSKGLTRFTENTQTDLDQYIAEIRRVRELGYATDYEEYIPGVQAVAAPIQVKVSSRSAIWAVGFKASLGDEAMKILIAETRKAAESISARIKRQPASK
jgi:DNA-binding IclR family transcriptional regulator